MGLSCYSYRNRFSELLDEQLATSDRDRVLEHLGACERCAGDYELLRKSHQLVLELKPLEVSPDFTQRVMARLREEQPAETGHSWSPRVVGLGARRSLRRSPGFWTAQIAAAAAVAALSVGLWHLMAHPRANTDAAPIAHKAAAAPAAAPAASGAQMAVTQNPEASARVPQSAASGHPAHARRHSAGHGSGSALAHKAYTDSLYDQPFDDDIRQGSVYTRPVSAGVDTGVHVVPVSSRGRSLDKNSR